MMDIHTATEVAYKNGYAKGFADGKTEVAREIFEDIEVILERLLNDPFYSNGDFAYDLVELKKKRMEDEA